MTQALRGILLLLCLGLAGCASSHRPQRPHRTGLWGEIMVGGGRLRMACSTCGDSIIVAPGGGGLIRIGGTVSDNVLMGWESAGFLDETFGFAANDSTTVAEMETVTIVVLWFPWRAGMFVKGGVGMAQGRFTIPAGATQVDSTKGTGIGMTFGLGWDVPISRKFALTANAGVFVTAIGDIVLPTSRVDDVIGTLYQFTLGITFR